MKNLLLPLGLGLTLIGSSVIYALANPGTSIPKNQPQAKAKSKPAKVKKATTPPPAALTPSDKIDALVAAKLAELDIVPNPPVDDATFLRRIYLDLAGRIPTIEEAEDFQADLSSNKREILIDRLLGSDAYVSHFYNHWADVLRILNKDGVASTGYQLWLKDSLRENKPWDEMVRELVAAKGLIWENGAVGYYMRDRGMPLDNMSNTVRVFLGVQLECAQCHDHPFDEWTQMDYYKMAAFTFGMDTRNYGSPNLTATNEYSRKARSAAYTKAAGKDFPMIDSRRLEQTIKSGKVQKFLENHDMTEKEFRKRVAKGFKASEGAAKEADAMRQVSRQLYNPLRYIATSEKEKPVKLPHDYQYDDAKPHDAVNAVTMFGDMIDIENIDSLADSYADWMTSPKNPTFTRIIANRLWKEAFGMGVFEPIDKIHDGMVITNEPLLEYLEELMVEVDYDMKAFFKILFSTQTYQREVCRDEIAMGEPYYFQGPILRRMSAEQIWDSIVALAIPGADSYRPLLKGQLASIQKSKLIYESLEEPSEEEFLANMKKWGPEYAVAQKKTNELRAKLKTATEKGDKAKIDALRRELNNSQKGVLKDIATRAYTKVPSDGKMINVLATAGMQEKQLKNDTSAGATMMMMDEQPVVFTSLPKPKFPDPPADLDRNEKRRWEQRQKSEYGQYKYLISKMARASELESPTRPGHFLREFGQSDRELIENSADGASVPQALNLLNGTIVEALINPYAVFGRRIHTAGDPEEKIKMIFQAMLTREPRADELEISLAEVERVGDPAYEGIVWALLNTRQFMFVQ